MTENKRETGPVLLDLPGQRIFRDAKSVPFVEFQLRVESWHYSRAANRASLGLPLVSTLAPWPCRDLPKFVGGVRNRQTPKRKHSRLAAFSRIKRQQRTQKSKIATCAWRQGACSCFFFSEQLPYPKPTPRKVHFGAWRKNGQNVDFCSVRADLWTADDVLG